MKHDLINVKHDLFFAIAPGVDHNSPGDDHNLATTMTNMPIVLPLDARLQEGDCNTQNEDKTELFDMIGSGVVSKFRVSGHDHCDDQV